MGHEGRVLYSNSPQGAQGEVEIAVAAELVRDEGWREELYEDHLGYLTIGYGFLVDPRKGGKLPRPVADFWLRWEVGRRREELERALPWFAGLPTGVQIALLNMAYQLGVPGLLKFRRMLAALEMGRREEAAEEALDSLWARQTPGRAQRVAAAIRGRPGRPYAPVVHPG